MEEHKTKINERYERYWAIVEKALNDGTKYGYKIAIIETEKILRISLDEKNIPGENYEEKILFVRKMLANPDKLRYSRAMYRKIIEEIGFDVSLDDTKDIIAGYYKAISDIKEMNYYKMSWRDKTILLFEKYSKILPSAAKNIIVAVFLFFTAIFITSETEWGRNLSSFLADASRFIFFTFIPAVIILTVIMFLFLFIIAYIKKKKEINNTV